MRILEEEAHATYTARVPSPKLDRSTQSSATRWIFLAEHQERTKRVRDMVCLVELEPATMLVLETAQMRAMSH